MGKNYACLHYPLSEPPAFFLYQIRNSYVLYRVLSAKIGNLRAALIAMLSLVRYDDGRSLFGKSNNKGIALEVLPEEPQIPLFHGLCEIRKHQFQLGLKAAIQLNEHIVLVCYPVLQLLWVLYLLPNLFWGY
jgi:hypothetical protein